MTINRFNSIFAPLHNYQVNMAHRFFITLFILFQFISTSKSQESGWFPISEGEVWARTGYFFDDSLGYVFGGDYQGNAFMYKTEDQGISWDTISSYVASWRPSDAEFINPMVGFLGYSNNGYIKKTEDGGATWNTNAIFNFYKTADIEFITDSIGFITMSSSTGDVGKILKTIDQGANWIQCTAFDLSPTISNWFSPGRICAFNEDTIFVMATGSGNWNPPGTLGTERFLRTYNGGDQWLINGLTAINVYATDMQIFPNGEGLLAGQQFLLTTEDFGLTWDTVHYPMGLSGVDGFFVNESVWHFATYSGVLFSTYDSGNSWTFYEHGQPYSREDFVAIDGAHAFSLGYPIYKYTDELMRLKGNLFYDSNQNQLKDADEQGLANVEMNLSTYAGMYFTDHEGNYEIIVDSGVHTITALIDTVWNLTTDSISYTRTPFSAEPHSDSLNFGFYPNTFFSNLDVHMISDIPRCDDTVNVWISITNLGTTLPAGSATLTLADSLSFVSSVPEPDTVIGQTVLWDFDSIPIYQDSLISLRVATPDFNSIGDTLTSYVDVFVLDSTNTLQFADADTTFEVGTCAYDPNDKTVYPVGEGDLHYVALGEELVYTIRFQNTGNATAHDVRIIDSLSTFLSATTFRYLASSADVQISISPERVINFFFEDIFLPDSNANEPESHGFVLFSIASDTTVAPNTAIANSANIYFDYNPPVITNQVFNIIECYQTPPEPSLVFNLPFIEVSGFQVSDYEVQWFLNGEAAQGETGSSLIPEINGVYTIELTDSNGCKSVSEPFNFLSTDVRALEFEKITITPNPAISTATVTFDHGLNDNWTFSLIDMIGREQALGHKHADNKIVFDVAGLSKGTLLIQGQDKMSGTVKQLGKLVIQ